MWAVCDVSAVQPHLYLGLFGWGYATLKIVPMYAHLNLSCSKRGGAKGLPYAQACHVGCVSGAYPGFQRGGCLRSGPIRKVGGVGAVHFRSDI